MIIKTALIPKIYIFQFIQKSLVILVLILNDSSIFAQLNMQEYNDLNISSLIKVDYEGMPAEKLPQLIIRSTSRINISKNSYANSKKLIINDSSKQIFSIVNKKGALVNPGKGLMVSMKVRATLHTDTCDIQLMVNEIDENGINTEIPVGEGKIHGTKTTWLSSWYFRHDSARVPQSIELVGKDLTGIEIYDILFTYSPEMLTENSQAFIDINEDKLYVGDKPVVLKGVNLPAYGHDDVEDYFNQLSKTKEDDYQRISGLNFNVVRLNLWYKALMHSGGWEWLNIQRLWAQRNGLYLILDMHAPPGGYQSPLYKGTFWDGSAQSIQWMDQLVNFWAEAAQKYKNDPVIAAFDLFNEPNPDSNAKWWSFVDRMVKAIRENGFKRPIIVESIYAPDFKLQLVNDQHVIYDFHFYDPWEFASGENGVYNTACLPDEPGVTLNKQWIEKTMFNQMLNFANKQKVPVNVGEFGISNKALSNNGLEWLKDVNDVLNQYNISHQYWVWHSYNDFGIVENPWDRTFPVILNQEVVDIISTKKQHSLKVANTKGLVAFWDFNKNKNGIFQSVSDTSVTSLSFPVYLKRIDDTTHYSTISWPYKDENSTIEFDYNSPFGNAIKFNKGFLFGEVPRISFDKTPLDINGNQPFTMIAWVKFVGERHLVAGIWDEGGWNKYSGRRQVALFGGLFNNNGTIAHISSTGAASYPQSNIEGAQYARERAIDGQPFENNQWVAMAMTFDPDKHQVTAYLNGKMTSFTLTDPVEQDVFHYTSEQLANPYQYNWSIYSPQNFVLKYNGMDTQKSGVQEQWLQVNIENQQLKYGILFSDGKTDNIKYRVTFDIKRKGKSLLANKLRFGALENEIVKIPVTNKILPGDIIETSLQLKGKMGWQKVGKEVNRMITDGAPFTFGRAMGLGSDVLEDGSHIFIDGVAVFNRVLTQEELKNLCFEK